VSAIELIQILAQLTWVAIGTIEVVRAIRRPSRSNIDIAFFFGVLALVTVEGRVVALLDVPYEDVVRTASIALVMALPYLMLRITRDFAGVRPAIRHAAEIGLAASAVIAVAGWVSVLPATMFLVLYFAAVTIYCAARAVGLAASTYGVTRQRMRAVAAGSYFLGIAILIAGVGIVAPALAGVVGALTQLGALASAVSYAIGFTPPNALRRYWQIPELRSFLRRSATLPRATMSEIVDDLAGVAGRALGARASIGLWDGDRGVLRYRDPAGALPEEIGPSTFLAWRVFETQLPLYAADAATANPAYAEGYRRSRVGPILIAPITAGTRRLGVLEVFASREPVFAEDDLDFVQLMAQQAAVLLESRALIDDVARVRAQEESARLKEDFVSAAAHDLKTPLTTIMAQAQLLERRAERDGRSSELPGLRRLVRETAQLSRLVEELLDASRLERGALPIHLEDGDLAAVVREAADRERPGGERIDAAAEGPLRARFDPERIRQLVDNLIENALKYSPAESPVEVRAWEEDGSARLAVRDHGIGIPSEDMPHVFERFRRGSNVDHRRFSGIGLGLYICKGIAEQHGGRIWAESAPGRGTTFHVALPLEIAITETRPVGDRTAVAS
jgi:signal transduction histidine kinase